MRHQNRLTLKPLCHRIENNHARQDSAYSVRHHIKKEPHILDELLLILLLLHGLDNIAHMGNLQQVFRRALAKQQLVQLQGCPHRATYAAHELVLVLALKGLDTIQLLQKIRPDKATLLLGRQDTLHILVVAVQGTLGNADGSADFPLLIGNQLRTAATDIHQQSLPDIGLPDSPQEVQLRFLPAGQHLHGNPCTPFNLRHRIMAVLHVPQGSRGKNVHLRNIQVAEGFLEILQHLHHPVDTGSGHPLVLHIGCQPGSSLLGKQEPQLVIPDVIDIHADCVGTYVHDCIHYILLLKFK